MPPFTIALAAVTSDAKKVPERVGRVITLVPIE